MRLPLSVITGALLLWVIPGCGQSSADSADDDHHLEHFVPHHKPANFADAVAEIDFRTRHLSEHAGHGHAHEAEEFQELVEIVDWIPELAADSDLNEPEWNKARNAAARIAGKLEAAKGSEGDLNLGQLPDQIDAEFRILKQLIPAAGKPEKRISHDHSHDHDHHDHHDHDHHDHDHDDGGTNPGEGDA